LAPIVWYGFGTKCKGGDPSDLTIIARYPHVETTLAPVFVPPQLVLLGPYAGLPLGFHQAVVPPRKRHERIWFAADVWLEDLARAAYRLN